MNMSNFNLISQKVKNMEQEIARSEGMIASLQNNLKTNHGCTTIEEGQARLTELAGKSQLYAVEIETRYNELNTITDWSKV